MVGKENSYACTVVIAGRTRTLRVSVDALTRFGKASGVDIIGNPGGLGSVETLAKLIHELAAVDDPELTLETVRASMSGEVVQTVTDALAQLNRQIHTDTHRRTLPRKRCLDRFQRVGLLTEGTIEQSMARSVARLGTGPTPKKKTP